MEAFLAHCADTIRPQGGMLATFFLGGLMGSLTHCLMMCGPLVACHSACRGSCTRQMALRAEVSYHVARLIVYGALGFASTLAARQVAAAADWPLLSATMIMLAGMCFVLSAALPARHRLRPDAPNGAFLRGVMMSFMPCGLIYAALMLAATLPSPWHGMVAMWLFVLGTMPVLLIASGSIAAMALRGQQWINGAGRVGLAFNGLALFAIAAETVR